MTRAAWRPTLAGLACLVCLASSAPAQKPNIVLMLADNLGYGDVGFLGTGGELRGMPTPPRAALLRGCWHVFTLADQAHLAASR